MPSAIRAFALALLLAPTACSDDKPPTSAPDAAVSERDADTPDAEPELPPTDAELDADTPIEIDPRTCSELELELNEAFTSAWRDPNACTSDAECVFHPLTFTCPGQEGGRNFTSCRIAIHADSAAAVDTLIASVEDAHCPTLTGCFGVGDCGYTRVACQDGACVPLR